ncbi:hypothetical protein BEH94_03860 [Candidatus Altiarchaeales archaeon WOR_SM1_SCG]|nr:hypothetical protein BEH94_03860 [Candidatus Altiarchaeales archaeon WOR_SM1_SCG]
MKTRVSITAKGEVQKVGYRDVVQKIAQDIGVKGFVENLRDGNVLVVAEGEKETIEEFIKKIKIKKDFIDVKDISEDYEKATGEFEYFEIKYGRLEEEFGERVGAAIQYLKAVDSKVEDVGSKVEAVGNKVENVGSKVEAVGNKVENVGSKVEAVGNKVEDVGSKVEAVGNKVEDVGGKVESVGDSINMFRNETKESFVNLRNDYGKISRDIATAIQGIERVAENTEKILEKSEQDREDFRNAIRELANAIVNLSKTKS